MRILSQDGTFDYPYDECVVVQENNQIRCCLCIDLKDVGTVMACYSTEAKARKAMEMLHEAYTGIPLILQNVDISDDVKEMFEKWKKQGICVVSENQPSKIEYVGNILFRFPADDEVKV